MVLSTFNRLPPELIVEISDYLDGCDLYRAFHGLNQHINTVLDEQCHRLHVDFTRVAKVEFDLCCQRILPRVGPRVVSLTLGGSNSPTPGILQQLLLRFDSLASVFAKLESFQLRDFTKSDVECLLPQLLTFTQLKNLAIGSYTRLMPFAVNEDELFNSSVTLPASLRSLAFPYQISDRWIQGFDTKSSVEQLHVHLIQIDVLPMFLQRVPRLRRLTTVLQGSSESHSATQDVLRLGINVHDLRYLNVNVTSEILFEQFASLLRNVPQLHTLCIEALNPTLPFLEARQWESVLPVNLSSFRFDFTITREDKPDHLPLWHAFQSPFWTSRGWLAQCRLRDRGRYFRFSTVQSPIITTLCWPDDEVLLNSTTVAVYPHVTHVDLWWNVAKSTHSICPRLRSIHLYGCFDGEIKPIHPNVCELLQTPSLEQLIINKELPMSQLRFASILAKAAVHVDTLTCSTVWLLSLLETADYERVCLLISMRIRKLILNDDGLIMPPVNLIAFTRTFLNLRELTMKVLASDDMFFLLNVLRQLTMANFELLESTLHDITDLTQWIQTNTILLDFTVRTRVTELDTRKMILWIGSRRSEHALGANDQLYLNFAPMNSLLSEDHL